ncbi:MAG: Flp pilus assembly complex ATPase component TadA [Acidobacteria bacterium]|nr:Flp pilus assembly complex ATPase component TadA [Acidobacteriota bacterium]
MPPTPVILGAMLRSAKQVSDLIFSPGRIPQVEQNGQLVGVRIHGVSTLTPEDTARIASHLIGSNKSALEKLRTEGSCDISYSLPRVSRFRVNIFTQRGTCAIVMRVIPNSIPDFAALNLPPQLGEIATLKNGIVLVTGPTGSGKSSTLAAILNRINEEKAYHIVTIEIAMEAAETGHLVFSTLHTIDASKTVERIIGVFPLSDQETIRNRFAKSFRYIISQRLIPRRDGMGRVAAIEILKSTMRTREYLEKGEEEGRSLVDAMRDGELEGMQHFDLVIEKLIRSGTLSMETGLSYATNAGNLRLELADLGDQPPPELVAS